MSADDRIARLEQRVVVLEALVRDLIGRGAMAAPPTPPPLPISPVIPETPATASASATPASATPTVEGAPAFEGTPAFEAARPSAGPFDDRPAPPSPRRQAHDASLPFSEQWLGQRGLLAVGVTALILAAGYLLKLSFDRGWISPIARCLGGTFSGLVVGTIGWRLQPRYRTYGAALIGCGAAIIYLSMWAASRLYGVLPPTNGILALALVSIALAMVAIAIGVEALAATAALGAFFAPILLGQDNAQANLLLIYLATMAAGLGLVAARHRWRLTALIVAASYFGVGALGAADRAYPWAVLGYSVVGGAAALYLGFRERWWETRFLAFGGGWALLGAASHRLGPAWPILVGAIVLAAPVWWHALRSDARWALRAPPSDALYFFLTPFLLGWAVYQLAPDRFEDIPGLVPLLVAVPYLLAGYLRPRPTFALIGAAGLVVATWEQWADVTRVWPLLGLVLVWATLDRRLGRTDGRWYAFATLAVALWYLFGDALAVRPEADAAFVGPWALALAGAIAVTFALAARLWPVAGDDASRRVRDGLWIVAGAMALFGVTGEIRRYFALSLESAEEAGLAAGLAVSAWWVVFAAVLVVLGLRRSLAPARFAGLAVAAMAVVKVIVYDLSSLDALYRVGSVFMLGLVSLSLAYLYNRAYISRP